MWFGRKEAGINEEITEEDMLHVKITGPNKQEKLFTLRDIPQCEVIAFGFCHAPWQLIFLSAYNCVCLQLIICVNLSRLLLQGFMGYIGYFKWRWAQQENK